MPRELEDYRPVMAELLLFFDGKRQLTAKEVATYDGCDPRTAAKRYEIGKQGIDITVLARKKCRM